MARKTISEFPFSLEDRMGCIQYPIIAIEETFQAVRAVYRTVFPEPHVQDTTILREYISQSREASSKEKTIYYVPAASENPIQTHIAFLRRTALEVGATPEAIRLLGSLEPFTKKEEAILAEKLKAKAKPVKASTDELKSAAKAAPVAKGKGGGGRGNADNLAKARAARKTGPDNRKIKANVKAKDLKARPGTFRRKMLEDLLSSKTVQEFRDKDKAYDAGCVAHAVSAGHVTLS